MYWSYLEEGEAIKWNPLRRRKGGRPKQIWRLTVTEELVRI